MLQSSLHLLSVLLVIHHINSTNINEPLIDSHTTTINVMENEPQLMPLSSSSSLPLPLPLSLSSALDGDIDSSNEYNNPQQINKSTTNATTVNNDAFSKSGPSSARNQSIDSPRSAINSIVNNSSMEHIQIHNRSTSAAALSSPNVQPATKKSNGSGKAYNKNDLRKRKIKSTGIDQLTTIDDWKCPNISENSRYLECTCDIPYTLRCSGDIHGLQQIAHGLRQSKYPVSLLDCTLKNVTFLSDARIFDNVSLHGLVISSGEIKRVHRHAFLGLKMPLQALGLPNNALMNVPAHSLTSLTSLDRLDLSNNRIKYLGPSDFLMLQNLTYLELSDNNISEISTRSFLTLKRLQTLKLNGNRLESGSSLQAIGQCVNLRELDLSSNLLRGPLTHELLPMLKSLESLNLGTNLLTSIHTGAFESFPFLLRLSLTHNQIDVIQDHAFSGLNALQTLDLSYNGIVAVSGASLKHLSRLIVLNLTHNFLRALTSDLVMPLPSLKELRLDGNDISMVARSAFNGTRSLDSLSLKDNPLSCDCSLKPFAEWLQTSKIAPKDQMSATCATPPHLEGATLQEIPLDSLNCDGNVNSNNNRNVLQQLELRSHETNLTFENKFSDDIILKNIHLSMDYGLILTWNIMLDSRDISCDAIFVYKEYKSSESLMENLPVHCESNQMENENIVSVILYDISRFTIGNNYRFCLVLVQRRDDQTSDLVVGCSNITKLKQIETVLAHDQIDTHQLAVTPVSIAGASANGPTSRPSPPVATQPQTISDISSFEKITDLMQNDHHQQPSHPNKQDAPNDGVQHEHTTIVNRSHGNRVTSATDISSSTPKQLAVQKAYTSQLMNHFNDTFMPSLSIGVLITSICAFIWAATKITTHHRRTIPSTVCYAASDQHSVDIENSNRYLKLQATTTL